MIRAPVNRRVVDRRVYADNFLNLRVVQVVDDVSVITNLSNESEWRRDHDERQAGPRFWVAKRLAQSLLIALLTDVVRVNVYRNG